MTYRITSFFIYLDDIMNSSLIEILSIKNVAFLKKTDTRKWVRKARKDLTFVRLTFIFKPSEGRWWYSHAMSTLRYSNLSQNCPLRIHIFFNRIMVTTSETKSSKLYVDDASNPRGIPSAVFIVSLKHILWIGKTLSHGHIARVLGWLLFYMVSLNLSWFLGWCASIYFLLLG